MNVQEQFASLKQPTRPSFVLVVLVGSAVIVLGPLTLLGSAYTARWLAQPWRTRRDYLLVLGALCFSALCEAQMMPPLIVRYGDTTITLVEYALYLLFRYPSPDASGSPWNVIYGWIDSSVHSSRWRGTLALWTGTGRHTLPAPAC